VLFHLRSSSTMALVTTIPDQHQHAYERGDNWFARDKSPVIAGMAASGSEKITKGFRKEPDQKSITSCKPELYIY